MWMSRRGQRVLRFSADCLPRLLTTSYSIVWPSLRELKPARSTAEIWTNTSLPPSCGAMSTRWCVMNKAKLEYRECTRFSQGVQKRDVIENKSPNPLDNRADSAHRHAIIDHNT